MLSDRLRTTRLDAALAAAFTLAGLVQVILVPIADPGIGELYVVGSTLPLAWRRTYPVESSLVSSAACGSIFCASGAPLQKCQSALFVNPIPHGEHVVAPRDRQRLCARDQ